MARRAARDCSGAKSPSILNRLNQRRAQNIRVIISGRKKGGGGGGEASGERTALREGGRVHHLYSTPQDIVFILDFFGGFFKGYFGVFVWE